MLWPDELWPQEIGALAVLDGSSLLEPGGRFRIEAVREAIEARLHLVPRFRQLLYIPRRGLGPPLWVDALGFNLDDHVRVAPVPAPGDEAQLLIMTEQLRRQRLDRSRPLWEMWFLPGLPQERVGLFVRIHHVIADGIAGVATVGAFLDAAAAAPSGSGPPWIPAPPPTAGELIAENLRRQVARLGSALSALTRPVASFRPVQAAWPMVRGLVAEPRTPGTSLDRVVGPHRHLALIRSNLDVVKRIAHSYDAKVNDVLLTLVAGGLRALLRSRGELVDDMIMRTYVPVTLRHGNRDHPRGNLIGQIVVRLPIGLADPGQRLRQIVAETAEQKLRSHPSLGTLLRSRIARSALLKVLDRQPVNVTTADLPGPQTPKYLVGALLAEVFPVLPLIGKVPLGVGALSYAGQFNIMVVADREACPDLDIFTASLEEELRVLEEHRHNPALAD